MAPVQFSKVGAMVVGAMFLIVGGDTAATVLTREGTSPTFVAWTRFAIAAIVLAPFCAVKREEVQWDWRLIFRATLIVLGIVFVLTALQTETVPNVFGAFFVSPVVAFTLSVFFLGEKASWARAALLLVGFAGVMLVVRPGFGMTPGLGFALLAGTCHGCYLTATRWMAGDYRPRFLLLSQLVIGAVLLVPFAFGDWPVLNGTVVGLLVLSALGSAFGNLLLVLANRIASANVIAPLVYSQLVHAALLGWLVFGDWPDGLSLVGLLVILLSGMSSLWIAARGR